MAPRQGRCDGWTFLDWCRLVFAVLLIALTLMNAVVFSAFGMDVLFTKLQCPVSRGVWMLLQQWAIVVFLTWLTVDYFVNFIPRFHGRWTGETEDVHGYLPLGFVATIFWLCALSLLLVIGIVVIAVAQCKGSADALSPWETFSSFNSPFDIALVLLFDGMLIAWCIVFLCAHNDARKEEKRSDNHIRQGGTVGGSSETSRLLSEQESAARRRRSDAPSDEP